MKNWLKNFNQEILSHLETFGKRMDSDQVRGYVVGGFVRDLILKRPNIDLDIVVESDAISWVKNLSRDYDISIIAHHQFGTATVIFSKDFKIDTGTASKPSQNKPFSINPELSRRIDFATARQETYPHSGALPIVKPGTIKDDLLRRDFTVNAMAIRLNTEQFGELVDLFDGMKDLNKKSIRILHDKSFIDDPTRILRAVRFEQRFLFQIEPKTLGLLKGALAKNVVSNVKPERYFQEFKKMFLEEKPSRCIERLSELKALGFMDLNRQQVKRVLPFLKKIEARYKSFKLRFAKEGEFEWWLCHLIALLGEFPESKIEKLLKKYNLSNKDRKKVLSLKEGKKIIKALGQKNVLPSGVYQLLKPLSLEAIFVLSLKTRDKIILRKIEDFLLKYDAVRLAINGHDLNRLGIVSGEKTGVVLKKIFYGKIDGKIKTFEDELKKARDLKETI